MGRQDPGGTLRKVPRRQWCDSGRHMPEGTSCSLMAGPHGPFCPLQQIRPDIIRERAAIVCPDRRAVHTMAELKLSGNHLKGSRPLLNFDKVSWPDASRGCVIQTEADEQRKAVRKVPNCLVTCTHFGEAACDRSQQCSQRLGSRSWLCWAA